MSGHNRVLWSICWRVQRKSCSGNSYCNFYYYKWGLIGVLSNCWGPIKDTKRTRGRLDRNVAPCSRPTTNVIGPLHECKKVCPWMQESVSMHKSPAPVRHSRMNQARFLLPLAHAMAFCVSIPGISCWRRHFTVPSMNGWNGQRHGMGYIYNCRNLEQPFSILSTINQIGTYTIKIVLC